MFVFKIVGVIVLYFNIVENSDIYEHKVNKTIPKDMYVVRATVYQVGILTNRTNDSAENNSGHQEAITIYHKNGTTIDLNSIPDPLLTNITAEKVVGLAPANNKTTPWAALKQFVSEPHIPGNSSTLMDMKENTRKSRRDATNNNRLEISKGATIIPSEAGIQSISLPPLLTLNKNLSKIPVPIPNMSVVSYAKVNTLVLPKVHKNP